MLDVLSTKHGATRESEMVKSASGYVYDGDEGNACE